MALDDLARAMSGRGAEMPAEAALTIALLAVEAMRDEAAALDPAGVEVDGRGRVELTALCPPTDDERAPQVGVLTLLEAMRVAPSARVAALLTKLRSQTTFSLTALRSELAAQAPADRAAAQRAVGAVVREFFRPAREEAEAEAAAEAVAEAARAAAAPAARAEPDVVQALIAQAKAAEEEARVMPGRQATVSIVGGEPAPLRAPPPTGGVPMALVSLVGVVVALVVVALVWSRMRG